MQDNGTAYAERVGNFVEEGALASMKLLEALLQALNSGVSDSRYNASHESAEGAKAVRELERHVKKGGSLVSDSIDPKDASMFRDLLKAYGITFSEFMATDKETGDERIIFCTKDADRERVNVVRERYKYEMNLDVNEIAMADFVRNNEGNRVYCVQGLDRAEVEAFRHNAAAEDVSFAVQESSEAGKYDIYYIDRDARGVQRALESTAFDLAGEKGGIYKKNIEKNLSERDEFIKKLNPKPGETIYVADGFDPGRFIAVTDKGFSTHVLKRVRETGNDVIRESSQASYPGYADLLPCIESLRSPVILSSEEMEFVREIDENGKASVIPDTKVFDQAFKNVMFTMAGRKERYRPLQVQEILSPEAEVLTLSNLPDDFCRELEKLISDHKLHHTAVNGNCVAYSVEDKAKMDKILSQTLYKGLSREQLIEARMLYGGHGTLDLSGKEEQYVINAYYPNYVFRLNEDGLAIINEDKKTSDPTREVTIERGTRTFGETLYPILEKMEAPAVLTKDEFFLPRDKRAVIIHEREANLSADAARSDIYLSDEREKLEMHDKSVDYEALSPRQKEARDHAEGWRRQEYLVDRNFIEKFVDRTTEPKKTHEVHKRPVQDQGHDL